MSIGTVRGRVELDAPALRTLKELHAQGIKTEKQFQSLGKTIDGVAGKDDVARLKQYDTSLKGLARTEKTVNAEIRKQWIESTRVVKREIDTQLKSIAMLDAALLQLSKTTARPRVDLDGVAEAIAQVELLEAKLAAVGAKSASPRISPRGVGGGMGGGGGPVPVIPSNSRGGIDFGGRGIRPRNLAIGGAVAYARPLIGAATAVSGSALSGLAGAGALGIAGGLGLGVGGVGSYLMGKSVAGPIGEASKAQQKYNEQVRDFGRASDEARKAKRELDQAMADAPRGTRDFLRDLGMLKKALTENMQPGQNSMMRLFSGSVRRATAFVPRMTRAGNRVAATSEREGLAFSSFLTGRVGARALNTGANIYDQNLGNVRAGGQYGIESMVNIATAAQPFFKESTEWLERWTRGWATGTRDIDATRRKLKEMVRDLKDWKNLGGATYRLFRDIFGAGRGEGRSAVRDLTDQLNEWDRFVQQNPEKVKGFFRDTVNSTKELAKGLASITGALNDIFRALGPALDRFSQLMQIAGSLGVFAPGVFALGRGAYKGARGGAGGGMVPVPGGGGGAGGAGGGGGAGRTAGGLALGAGGLTAARDAWFYMRTRDAGVSRMQALKQARYTGAGGAGGGMLKGALKGAGKAFLPISAVMAGLDASAYDGSKKNKAQQFASTFTLGAIAAPYSNAQIRDTASAQVGDFMAPGRTVAEINEEIERNKGMKRSGMGRFLGGSDASFFGVVRTGGLSDKEEKERDERIKQLREEREELERLNKENAHRLGAMKSREVGSKRAGLIMERFENRKKKYGPGGEERAYEDTIGAAQGELGRLKPHGRRQFLAEVLPGLKDAAGNNKEMLADFNKFEAAAIKKMRGMAKHIAVINGQIYYGTKKEWGSIANAMHDAAVAGVSKTSAEWKRLRGIAIGALKSMGFEGGDLNRLFNATNSGSSRTRQMAEWSISNSSAPAATTDSLTQGTGGREGGTGDGIGIGGASPDDTRARIQAGRTGAASRPGQRAAGGGGGLMGAKEALSGYASKAAEFGLRVSSGLRQGAVTSSGNTSYHASGDALDLAGSPDSMMAFAQYAASNWGSQLEELIYTPFGGNQIKNGSRFTYTGQVAKDHYDHVHIADTSPGGVGGGAPAAAAGSPATQVQFRARKSGLGGVTGALTDRAGEVVASALSAVVNAAGATSGGAMSFDAVARLAESVGLPGVTFAQIAQGESGLDPRAVGNDPGGTKGLGLWQITTGFNDDIIAQFGGREAMFNPQINAQAAKMIFDRQGIGAWYGTKYVTGNNLHYQGDGIGFGGWFGDGASFTANRPMLIGVGDGGGNGEDVHIRPRKRPKAHGGNVGGSGGGGGGVSVAVHMGSVTVRSEADIDAIAERVGEKIRTALNGNVTDGDLLEV